MDALLQEIKELEETRDYWLDEFRASNSEARRLQIVVRRFERLMKDIDEAHQEKDWDIIEAVLYLYNDIY